MDRQITVRLRASGPLDPALVERAFQYLIGRHALLRASIQIDDGWAIIDPRGPAEPWRLDYADLSQLSPAEQAAILTERIRAISTREHDSPARTPIRVGLYTLGQDDHAVVLTVSHIVCDGWSVMLVQNELTQVYRQLQRGQEPALPPIASTYWEYLDYLERQRDEPGYREAQRYWDEVFREPLGPQLLPADLLRTADRSLDVAVSVFGLDPEQTEAIRGLASRFGITPYVLMLALLARRLQRWTGRSDLVIGMPTTGRAVPLPDAGRIVGCLVNVLPLRLRIAPDSTLEALLSDVSQVCAQALRHMNYPCERYVIPGLSFTFPYFAELIGDDEETAGGDSGITFTFEQLVNEIGGDDLDIIFLATFDRRPVADGDDGRPTLKEHLLFTWTYHPSLFRKETIDGLGNGLIADLQALVSGLPLLEDAPADADTPR